MTQLIVNTRGGSLSVRNGRYRVQTPEAEFYVPVAQVRSICLHPGTRLTYEAVMAAIEQDTDLLFIDRRGFPAGRLWSHRFGSVATVRKQQLVFAQGRAGREWVRRVLVQKLENQLLLLDWLHAADDGQPCGDASRVIARCRDRLLAADVAEADLCFSVFRGLEGTAGRVYFGELSRCLPAAHRFARRTHRTAPDAFNCLLNYAYGMLYGHCESALVRAGIDPFVGVMHRDDYNRPVLVYDFIESYRLWADYVVCHLLRQEVVFEAFFERPAPEQYWLGTLGKRVLVQAMNEYLAEVVTLAGLARSRGHHILLDAQKLASLLKKLPESPDLTPAP